MEDVCYYNDFSGWSCGKDFVWHDEYFLWFMCAVALVNLFKCELSTHLDKSTPWHSPASGWFIHYGIKIIIVPLVSAEVPPFISKMKATD